jgi:hypothetical protein
MNKLRLRRLLTCGFYWLPGDLILTIVLLACSIRKQRRSISPHENQVRRDNILLAIAILDDLAPEYVLAFLFASDLPLPRSKKNVQALQNMNDVIDCFTFLDMLGSILQQHIAKCQR